MKSVMHSFNQVPSVTIPRSVFDRSHGYKTTFDSDYLYPIFVDEALPGDTFNLQLTAFARMSTPLYPIMDNLHMDMFFFSVPYRLLWDNFPKFMGEQVDPGDSTDYLVPQMEAPAGTGHLELSLADYFGIPTQIAELSHSALPFRAYNLIWNEHFRDQNLQDSIVVDKDDADSDPADYVLLKRGKRHDYFTSCLPFQQKGDPVDIPLGTSAPVISSGTSINIRNDSDTTNRVLQTLTTTTIGERVGLGTNPTASGNAYWGSSTGLITDLSDATAATINSLRQAFQLQKMFEKDARGGTRYHEVILSHFGVTHPTSGYRSEYLGGGSVPVNIHPIMATNSSNIGIPGGYSTTTLHNGFRKSFTEHCVVIGLVMVRADLTYQRGLDRMWSRQTRYDFFWPSLQNLGEQAVLNKEIYAQGPLVVDIDGNIIDDLVFGYIPRFDEYRYFPSKITGKFRSNAATPLHSWHLSQNFGSLPVLNDEFIEETVPMDRIVKVTTEPKFIYDSYINYKCVRPMGTYAVPGLIDHF